MSGPARAPFESKHVRAIRALYAGEATAAEQQIAMKWILEDAAGVRRPSYVSGENGDRETVFNEGSKWVGSQIVYLIDTVNLSELVKREGGDNQDG